MKALLALLLSSALCLADPVAHAEPAKSGSPAGGAGERSEPEGVSPAEPAKSGSPAGEAGERSEPEGVPRAEPAESAEPAAVGGASSPSEPNPVRRGRRAQRPPLHAEVSLVDGSILKGTLRQHAIPACSPALGRVRIDLAKVERIDFIPPDSPAGSSAGGARSGRREGAGGAAEPGRGATSPSRIAFRNGDRLTVRFPDDLRFLPFDTLLGRVRLPLRAVSSLAIASDETDALIYHCTFDSASSIAHPAAGPAGRFLRGSFVPGKNGRALRVEADTPAFESKLPKGFLGPEGCLEFWAKIEGDDLRYVDGGDPLFVSLYDERRSITLLQFAANNGFARGGLGGAMAGWPFGTIPHSGWSMEYRKNLGDNWADWHHYAMSWKADGFGDGSFVKVFVDGNPQPVLGGVDDEKVPARLADYGNHAYDLGIPWHTSSTDRRRSKKPFLVDDLKIWSVAKTDFACSRSDSPIPHSAFRTQHSELLYHCTFDDAQSIEHPATGPAGTFLGGEFVPGKKGRALLVKARTPAAEVPFPTGLMQPEGCIEFWAKIPGATKETRYPDGGNPMFFAMSVGKWVNTFVKYTANDGFGTGGLHADLPGSAYISSRPSWSGSASYPDFLGDPSAWHHYALVWSEKGLDAASETLGRRVVSALYVDGRLVNPAYGTNGPDRAKFLRQFTDLPVVLGFPFLRERQDPMQGQVDYLIDEFKIWSVPKFDSAAAAVVPARQYRPELLYHCTFDSAEAIEHPAAGPNGTFLGGEFVPGKKGNALHVHKGVSSGVVPFGKNVLQPRGTIEFWAKIENDREFFADGGDPRFFMIVTSPGSETHLQFAANDGCGRGGLSSYHQGMSLASDNRYRFQIPYASILPEGSAKDWHHYALVWDENGVPGSDGTESVAVFVDGRRIRMYGNVGPDAARTMAERFRTLPARLFFPLDPSLDRGFNNKSDFLIDEFKIWSAAKTEFDIR